MTLAERAEPELRARDQVRWLNRLSAEHDNCAAALRFAIDGGDVRAGAAAARGADVASG